MIIIAESGSTKTKWLAANKTEYETIGFNPLFHSSESIYQELLKHEALFRDRKNFDKVFFYGASCSSPERKKIISDALTRFFDAAQTVQVDHDLKAAAIATYNGRTCITSILGTGSNSCRYDGLNIHQQVPALGYVLGDEGSGAYFGKKLVALFLYDELPEGTTRLLKEQFQLDKETALDNVYKKPYANVYLASLARVMEDSPDKALMEKILTDGFEDFFIHHICCFENFRQYPLHFVGSVAWFYRDALKKVADKFGCELGIINRSPAEKLLEWHLAGN
jgi:glucosamine kinase